jgi:hypothetical protein
MNYKRLLFNWLAKREILHLYKHHLLHYRNAPYPPSYDEDNILSVILGSFLWLATPEPAGFWSKCHKDWVEFYENYKLKHHEPKNK